MFIYYWGRVNCNFVTILKKYISIVYCIWTQMRKIRVKISYTGWVQKFYPVRFSENFSMTAENLWSKFYKPTVWLYLRKWLNFIQLSVTLTKLYHFKRDHPAPLYPLQDFKALYKYCIVVVVVVVVVVVIVIIIIIILFTFHNASSVKFTVWRWATICYSLWNSKRSSVKIFLYKL